MEHQFSAKREGTATKTAHTHSQPDIGVIEHNPLLLPCSFVVRLQPGVKCAPASAHNENEPASRAPKPEVTCRSLVTVYGP